MSNHTQNDDWLKTVLETCLSKLSPVTALPVVVLTIFLYTQQLNSSTNTTQPDIVTQSQVQQYNSRAEYERLRVGMELVEVESILGRGIETERSQISTTFIWKNPDDSSIIGIFEEGKLQRKHQSNLQ